MTTKHTDLSQKVQAWIDQDPDATTRAELSKLLADEAFDVLAERFSGTLEFGTAGLRGILGGGPMCMNRAVVCRASAGLAAYLKAEVKDAATRGVVVGYDGRHMSREFAEQTAEVLMGAGLKTYLFDELCPTPMVAFASLQTNAAAGIMVTASHNPPEYNGYKVYWGNGAQIISPHDKGISAQIDAVKDLRSVPTMSRTEALSKGLLTLLGADMEKRYLAAIDSLRLHRDGQKDLKIVYTAMHGVGGKLARAALSNAGFDNVVNVAAQFAPDGNFPTVRFPNPEEKGALDLALTLAKQEKADLVIANDPDADRLAIAVPTPDGGFLQLSGDQVGALLGYYLLSEGKDDGKRLVVTTIVSSQLLSKIAQGFGARYEETLTGFKWIANRGMALEQSEGLHSVLGYEEALGYTIGQVCRDKDGISAALIFAELAQVCHSRGQTVLSYLESIYRRFGLFISRQKSLVMPGASGAAQIQAIMAALRQNPPKLIGERKVIAMKDIDKSEIVDVATGQVTKLDLPKSNVLVFHFDDARITCRPSGTEPKIKFYFELCAQVGEKESFADANVRGMATMDALVEEFMKAVG
ncbi:MAG: phospho-sugar mutase [Myxococcales bacterium]|jgi:phosphomannomutase|nr:phospho-sugar mutase [Myxococcales bacterium]